MIKRIIIVCAVLGMVACATVPVRAADTSLFNFGDLIHQLRVGYAINQHGEKGTVAYTSIITVHNKGMVDLFSLNAGYEGLSKHPTLMIGMRFDNLIPLLFNGEWGRDHISTAKLPTLEAGPFVSVWPKSDEDFWNMRVNYGLGIAIGF